MVLNELLWQVSYSYTYELRPYLDLLLHMMLLEDSWQNHRIHNALKGNIFYLLVLFIAEKLNMYTVFIVLFITVFIILLFEYMYCAYTVYNFSYSISKEF